jgi:ATP phosphoribosyltransferase
MVWESGVIEYMDIRYGRNAWIFQQDGASPHQANTTKQFLAAHCQALSLDLHWPAHSPDLNVIENLWAIIKRKMANHDARTQEELWVQVHAVWDEVRVDELNHLVESFRSRLQGVIALNGESLNGHRDVRRMLAHRSTPDEIIALQEEERRIVQEFIELSRQFFAQPGWNTVKCQDVRQESIHIVQRLPRQIRERLRMICHEEMMQSSNGN